MIFDPSIYVISVSSAWAGFIEPNDTCLYDYYKRRLNYLLVNPEWQLQLSCPIIQGL